MTLEFGVRTLPAVIFFFTGGYRYYNIKHTARSQVRYTNNFIAKVVISSLITIACVAYIPLIMAQPQNAKNSSLVNQCHVEGFCFFNLIQAAAWGFSVFLIIFEYQRLLKEARYSHQLFWVSSLVCQSLVVAFTFKEYRGQTFMLTTAFVYIGLNLVLVILVWISEKRSVQNMRLAFDDEMLLYSSTPTTDQRRYIGCILEVKF